MRSLDDIAEEYQFLEPDDRYRLLIELGRELDPMPDAFKTDATLVRGCSAQVWVYPTGDASGLHFHADSNAAITKGIVALGAGYAGGSGSRDGRDRRAGAFRPHHPAFVQSHAGAAQHDRAGAKPRGPDSGRRRLNTVVAAFGNQDWRNSIARADAADWLTVAAYLIAAILAILAARTELAAKHRERRFWTITAALMIFLGINELFDFQTVLTIIGRSWAQQQGWYEDRRLYQFEFIFALGVAAVAVGVAMLRMTRGAHRSVRVALLGLVFIGLFVLIRAASFHHFSELMGLGPDGFPIGSMQEMLGIVIVGAAAWSYRRRSGAAPQMSAASRNTAAPDSR